LTNPGAIRITGTPQAWDVAITYDTRNESLGDLSLSSAESLAGYAHTAYAAFHARIPVHTFSFSAVGNVKNEYGTMSARGILTARMSGEVASKINWDNEDFASFLALSQVTWTGHTFEQALESCASPCWPNILPTNFICDPVRLGLSKDSTTQLVC